jgi:trk system potassium uptake protein TrkA
MSRVPPRVHARGGSRESRGRERGNGSRCEAPPLTLSQAEPQRADVVVTMLHRDADNLAVAALSRSLGAKRVMVRMRDPLYRPVYEAAGVQQILSETEVLVGAFATAIEFEAVRHSMVLGSGSIAIELKVPSHARVVGRSVSDLANDPGSRDRA